MRVFNNLKNVWCSNYNWNYNFIDIRTTPLSFVLIPSFTYNNNFLFIFAGGTYVRLCSPKTWIKALFDFVKFVAFRYMRLTHQSLLLLRKQSATKEFWALRLYLPVWSFLVTFLKSFLKHSKWPVIVSELVKQLYLKKVHLWNFFGICTCIFLQKKLPVVFHWT